MDWERRHATIRPVIRPAYAQGSSRATRESASFIMF
jgi:hypothetical protein